jgi:hypothetical protein
MRIDPLHFGDGALEQHRLLRVEFRGERMMRGERHVGNRGQGHDHEHREHRHFH